MGNYQKLTVWKLAKDLAVDVYKLVEQSDRLKKDFRLVNQITSSAVSISSNIAEGDELNTVKQGINHFHIARGSCAEFITQIIIAKEIGFIDESEAERFIKIANRITASLFKLIQVRSTWK